MNIRIVCLLIGLILTSLFLFSEEIAQGIVIADEIRTTQRFMSQSSDGAISLAEDIASLYEVVILHLGRKYVFRRGNLFFTKTSQRNLKVFCDYLREKAIKIYLWFYDSFGNESFLDIYSEYQEIVHENMTFLNELTISYDGIVIDLEWINYPNGDNAHRLIHIVKYLKQNIGGKDLFLFAPLIDNKEENIKRGYREEELLEHVTNIIPMLYVKDGGFHLQQNEIKAYLRPGRIDQIRSYFSERNYITCVSLEGGILITNNDRVYFIKTVRDAIYPYLGQSELKRQDDNSYYRLETYKATVGFPIEKNDRTVEQVNQDDLLFFLHVKKGILQDKDIIWEYFLIHAQ